MEASFSKISVLGAGSWGTALALLLDRNGARVTVVAPEVADRHRDIENDKIRAVLEARRDGGRPIVGRDGAKAKRFELIHQQLNIRLNVIRHEDECLAFFASRGGVHRSADRR